MLNRHLQQARASQSLNPPDSRIGQSFAQWHEEFDPVAELEDNLMSNHKTLAERFSKNVGSTTEKRLGKFKHLIEAKAKKYDLDPNLLAGLIKQESNFNPYAVSHCGAMGLGQLMPETARTLGVKDPFNAAQNLEGAAKYLREQLDRFGGNIDKALAAYNAGPGAVTKYGGIPPYRETQNYVKAIKSHKNQIVRADYFNKKKADLA